ncbi:hypothetical protein TGDOM2_281460 [Toxoplasma gondii GAB2-2007-GAL-DOM2]|uniref:Uncharacterized protein n=2 Tax=Toxoplasma gondii TaxID=5811 RepID=A0A086JWE7_TOXGO|nr:hypothetical protein TGFOU_281460 [Toxoplasma gondii FOU]KFG41227.1 hypothetical protein TGDOM2_281460 [Toxoplasma gondii GAB2-2007-GAL-DOM2]
MPTQTFQASSVEANFRCRSCSLQPRIAGALLLYTACSVVVVLSLASADVVSAAAENDEAVLRQFPKAWGKQAMENYENETAGLAPAATSDLSADPPEAGEDGVFLGSRLWQSSSDYYKALVDRLPEMNALMTSASEFLAASQARLSTAWTESREKLSSAFTQTREEPSSLSKLLPKRADCEPLAFTPVTAKETNAALLAGTVPAELTPVFSRDVVLRNRLQLARIPVLSRILEVILGQGTVSLQRHRGCAAPAELAVSRAIRAIQTMSSGQLSQIEAKYESVLCWFGVHRGQLPRGLQIAVGDSFASDEPDAYAPVYALPAQGVRRVDSGIYEEESNDAL